jgi:hypothetical protein
LTRARDRLYLGSVLKEGRLQPGRGSLADVLPATLKQTFGEAQISTHGAVTWRAASGTTHRFVLCADSARSIDGARSTRHEAPGTLIADDFEPLVDHSIRRDTVAAVSAAEGETLPFRASDSDRLVGSLVHRMLDRYGLEDGSRDAESLVRPDELVEVFERGHVADRAAALYARVCMRADIRALYSAGRRLHEVPFTMRHEGRILRGTIDCLIVAPHRGVTIIEFKTGRPRPEHRMQLDLYRRAAERMFPGARVEALLVYPDAAADV